MTQGALLETKLFAPRLRPGLVPRPRLAERLQLGARSRLTLVSAPAGFGKSTLLAEWLASTSTAGSATAWVSLDDGDNDPVLFWRYVIAALRTAAPEVGASAISALASPDPPIQSVLATVLNELNAVPSDVVLVLDDYHVIGSTEIQDGMAFVVEHLPARVHLVIVTRTDPALPLARLRARGELVEVRATDLRFSADEAGAYFNGVLGLSLTPPDVAALEGRTEGWVAALQLAGLSMQGREDVGAFIAGFAGDDRYIVDYLAEEVLQRQPEELRSFLLETSILARMSGPLCDAVTGRAGGRATLASLERANLFVIPLDDRRQWYRYHHLFADVLQARLLDERPDIVPELHQRATEWYEANGERAEAIRHALAGMDFVRAADLVEVSMPAMRRDRNEATLRRWLDELPDELVRARPVLSNGYAGSLLSTGQLEGVEPRLDDAERWLEKTAAAEAAHPGSRPPGMVVADEIAFRGLPCRVAVHRAGVARIRGDIAASMAHARRALELVGDNDLVERGGAAALLGLAHWTNGELDEADRWYAAGMTSLEQAGYVSDVIGGGIVLADIRLAQGRLTEALAIFERGLERATEPGRPVLRGAADMHVGISGILRERDDVAGATQHLQRAADLGEENGLPRNPYRSRAAAAGIRQAHGDLDGALDLLADAERVYVGDFHPDVRPVAAMKARVRIAQGNLPQAWAWARDRDLSAADSLSYLREFEHVTLARLLLAQGSRDRSAELLGDAVQLLERLLAAAEDGGRVGSVIEILVVLALARLTSDDAASAVRSLADAGALAEPEGYVRVFIDEGPPMAGLLKQAARQRNASAYVRRLLAAAVTTEGSPDVAQELIEPLSERELEVLRLLESDLDGPDMARELTVSLNTVRTHTKNIYAKLGVNSRRAAVSRAGELGLLSRTTDRRPAP